MRVSNIALTAAEGKPDWVELSADIDGFKLWYRFPSEFAPSNPADVFLCATLVVAMHCGQSLVIDAPCSRRLLKATRGRLQDILVLWFPELKLSHLEIIAEETETPVTNAGVGSFFSGGVDGTYTLLRHQQEITHLISVAGIDVQVDNDSLWQQAVTANQEFADAMGKKLVQVQTNFRRWCHPLGVGWGYLNGAGLASLAHALGFHRCYIASSHTYFELFPMGSHVLTDELWSTEGVELIHDGAEALRSEKLQLVSTNPKALGLLRVCWMDAGYNCGVCEKCIRTRITLRLLGLETPTLPRLEDLSLVKKQDVWGDNKLVFYEDNLELARNVGDDEMASALKACIKRYKTRQIISDFDKYLLNGMVRGTIKKIKKR